MQKQPRTRSWIDGTNLTLGTVLFCLAWASGPRLQAAEWNAWIVGGLIVFNAACAIAGFAAWEEWTNVILGSWVVISPWALGFQGNAGVTWTYVLLGCGVAGLAAVQLRLAARGRPEVVA